MIDRMRITFVAPRSWPSVGGAQSFLHHLATSLAERHDVQVLALSNGDEPSHRLWESVLPPPPFDAFSDGAVGVSQLRVGPARRVLLAPLAAQAVPGLRRYAFGAARSLNVDLYARTVAPLIARSAEGSDVIHMWGTGLLGAATIRAAELLGVPCAITPFAHPGQWGDDPASAATYRRAARVGALLQTDAALYRALGVTKVDVLGVCSPGVVSAPDRASNNVLLVRGSELRARHRIAGPLVMFLGVRRPYKGFDVLLEAAPRVPGATFAFVGPGPAVSGERVIDAGPVDDAERAAWLDAADLLCLPSQAEVFPVSILEAWSAGTPVLTSDIPSLRELIAASGGGLAVPANAEALAAALNDLLADPGRLARLGQAGHDRWRDTYTPSVVASRHEQLYAQLLEEEVACAA